MESSDKEVLKDGRANTLKAVDAPLRDQIVKKLFKKLEDGGIAQRVEELWTRGNANRAAWLERQQAYLASWDEHLVSEAKGAFEGSSKLHIPMPFIVVKTLHARYMQALWMDPPFHVKAKKLPFQERVPLVSDTLKHYLTEGMNYGKGAEGIVDQWVWDWLADGSGMLKVRWDVTYTRYIDVQTQVVKGAPQFAVENGVEVQRDTWKQKEVEVEVTKKCFDGPVFDLVNAEDLLIIGGAGDPDMADYVLHRHYMTASQLWTLVDRKVFKKDAVEEIIEHGRDNATGSLNSGVKEQRAVNAGQANIEGEQLDRYEIIEAHMKEDVDSSGISSDIVVWVHRGTGKLCHATYLHRISKRGERPFVKVDYHMRKGQEYGMGIPELIYPLSREMDAIHNMRIDWGLISVMPFGFYRATSGIDPETISFEPGTLIPVDNPATDVFFPNLGNRTVFGMQEEAAIQQMIERLTGVNDLSLGQMGSQGATRTATGARVLQGEMSSNLNVHLRRLNRGWKKALSLLFHNVQERMPAGVSFRITGEDGASYWRSVETPEAIGGDFDFEVSANSENSNPGIQQEKATQVLNLTSNPLDIQLGVVTPMQRYEALKNWYQAFGVKDFGRYVQKPEGPGWNLLPVQEADAILAGIDVPIQPNSDHDGFIALVQMFSKDEQLNGQMNQDQMMALVAQAKRHADMKKALASVAAQQANVRQMQMNSAQSQQQAPTGMSPQATPQGMPQGMPGQ